MKFFNLLFLLPLALAFNLGVTVDALAKKDQKPLDDGKDLSVPGDNPLNFCADPEEEKHILRIIKVDLDPNPPEAGKTLTIKATGNVTEQIEEGAYVMLTVKFGLITIVKRREDLCDLMKSVDKECPLEEGETVITRDVDLPSRIPPGKFTVQADAYTKDDKKLTCLNAEVTFQKSNKADL